MKKIQKETKIVILEQYLSFNLWLKQQRMDSLYLRLLDTAKKQML